VLSLIDEHPNISTVATNRMYFFIGIAPFQQVSGCCLAFLQRRYEPQLWSGPNCNFLKKNRIYSRQKMEVEKMAPARGIG
jgi:hypothetical protein